jgi:hypothetical protein
MTHKEFSLIGAVPGQYLVLHSSFMHTVVVRYLRHDKDRIYANWSVGLGLNYTAEAASVSLSSINRVTIIPGV